MKILTVEDDRVVLMDIADMLEELGHEAEEATSGEEALRAFGDGTGIDLVMTDLSMPGMSGAELTAEISRRAPGTPIIICSGSDDIAGPEIGAHGRLEKPFAKDGLAAAIQSVTGRTALH
jgi:CheY-like chemotaxis protein